MIQSLVKQQEKDTFNVEPVLGKVLRDAQEEHQELLDAFELMGWGGLPVELKIEIKDDIAAMVDECKGQYSTCDPFVLKRRQRIVYWVENYQDDICTLKTTVQALRIEKL